MCLFTTTNPFLIVGLLLSATSNQEIRKPIFRFSSWDLATIVKTTAFIDKSLLIKTFFSEKDKILIIAPRHCAKSTNLNMLKCFLEIVVNEFGKRRDIQATSNYKLFSEYKLKIFSKQDFFNENFGNYPVIFIDCKPLREIFSFRSMIVQFREIFINTFENHEYLLESPGLWLDKTSRNQFQRYCQCEGNYSLTESEIKNGFTFLSKLLFKHFNKKVFVLMDDYDAFVDSPFIKESPDRERIIAFIYKVNVELFKFNSYIFRTFATGVHRENCSRIFVPPHKILPDVVKEYNFQTYNPFCEFYGVTPDELDKILSKFLKRNDKEKAKSTIIIKSTMLEQSHQVYNLWSVLQFLTNFNVTNEAIS